MYKYIINTCTENEDTLTFNEFPSRHEISENIEVMDRVTNIG